MTNMEYTGLGQRREDENKSKQNKKQKIISNAMK